VCRCSIVLQMYKTSYREDTAIHIRGWVWFQQTAWGEYKTLIDVAYIGHYYC
jgi:hypothetical protein